RNRVATPSSTPTSQPRAADGVASFRPRRRGGDSTSAQAVNVNARNGGSDQTALAGNSTTGHSPTSSAAQVLGSGDRSGAPAHTSRAEARQAISRAMP